MGEEKLEADLQKRLENDPNYEEIIYQNLMSLFDVNRDGELSLNELVMGMCLPNLI
jgi:hypothetical protein